MQTIQRAVETSAGTGAHESSDPRKGANGHSASVQAFDDRRFDTGNQMASPNTCNASHHQGQSTDEGRVGSILPPVVPGGQGIGLTKP
jgi:hypothetical protein